MSSFSPLEIQVVVVQLAEKLATMDAKLDAVVSHVEHLARNQVVLSDLDSIRTELRCYHGMVMKVLQHDEEEVTPVVGPPMRLRR